MTKDPVLPPIPAGSYSGSPDRPVSYSGLLGLSWLSRSELAWMIIRLPDAGLFVEVGTASGVTAALVAEAKPGLTINCVDNYSDSDDPAVAENEPGRLVNWRANARPNMSLFVGTFGEYVSSGPSLAPDAVLVDGDHSFEGATSDLFDAWAVLRPGGSIFVHDCDEPAHPGVTRAVDDFCRATGFAAVGQHWTLRELRSCP